MALRIEWQSEPWGAHCVDFNARRSFLVHSDLKLITLLGLASSYQRTYTY